MRTISRRTAVAIMGAGSLAAWAGQSDDQKNAAPDPTAAAAWMDSWRDAWLHPKSGERQPEGGLYLGRFADPMYFLTKSITWKPNSGQEKYREVSAPSGFVTDLASIPRLFWSALRPDGQYAYPAIVHDYLYWFQMRSREESDTIFKLGMQDFSVDRVTVETIFNAVRIAGGSAWDENDRLRKAGEKRVLKKFPDDPRTTWAEWKKRPDVFA